MGARKKKKKGSKTAARTGKKKGVKATRKKASKTTTRSGSRIRPFQRASSTASQCSQATLILEHAHESADALLKAYDLARAMRAGGSIRAPRGMSTDEEQDLLRAMLVMAAAGLDSMVKQLVRDVLPQLVHRDEQARGQLERFVGRRFAVDEPLDDDSPRGRDFLAKVLSTSSPSDSVISIYVRDLTAGSMQSVEELARSASAFGLTSHELGIDFEHLRGIFGIRNKIIHELDINFAAHRRNRNVRRQRDMIDATNKVLGVGEALLRAIERKVLSHAGSP